MALTAAALVLDLGDGAALPPVKRVRHGVHAALEAPGLTRLPEGDRDGGEARRAKLFVREIG